MVQVSLLLLIMWNVEERDVVVTNTGTTTGSAPVFFLSVLIMEFVRKRQKFGH
jgi:hypothetical protein